MLTLERFDDCIDTLTALLFDEAVLKTEADAHPVRGVLPTDPASYVLHSEANGQRAGYELAVLGVCHVQRGMHRDR
jgi:hypothetical protein